MSQTHTTTHMAKNNSKSLTTILAPGCTKTTTVHEDLSSTTVVKTPNESTVVQINPPTTEKEIEFEKAQRAKQEGQIENPTTGEVLPDRGNYIVEVTTADGATKWVGHGKDWLVKSKEKAQVYKTLRGAKAWCEKQGFGEKGKILPA